MLDSPCTLAILKQKLTEATSRLHVASGELSRSKTGKSSAEEQLEACRGRLRAQEVSFKREMDVLKEEHASEMLAATGRIEVSAEHACTLQRPAAPATPAHKGVCGVVAGMLGAGAGLWERGGG